MATFAHELAHYLSYRCEVPPPGGEENLEFATDLLAVHMGFGIFLVNSAFTFSQYTDHDSQGWEYQRMGYLDQYALSHCLALWCHEKQISITNALPHIKPELRGYVKKRAKIIAKT